jgi:elongation factor P--beta-lysine ligase
MGMWIELFVLVIVLAIAFHQLHDVKKAQKKTAEEEAARRRRETETSEAGDREP